MSLELLELDGFSNKITCAIIETPIVEHSGVVYADAALVVDLFQVRVAVQLALAQQSRNLMKTAELDKEILYCLSPSKHVLILHFFGFEMLKLFKRLIRQWKCLELRIRRNLHLRFSSMLKMYKSF
jgi:hypothetical protein